MSPYQTLKKHLLTHQYTWLITGVAGFIGSNLLETLLKLNQNVVGIDNFANGFQKNLDEVLASIPVQQKTNFEFYQGDISQMDDCVTVMKNIDFVLHQAALGSIPRSIANPQLVNNVNISGFVNMLVAAKDTQVKRFVFASSSSVYGDSPQLPKIESQIGNPLSPYAVTKRTNELYAQAFSSCYDIETIGLRYFNVFGRRQNYKSTYAAVIPLWIKSLLNQEPVYINGDGDSSRDFCYVENVVQANLLAATTTNQAAINTIYNIAVGQKITLNDLYKNMTQILAIDKQPIYRDFRQGDIRHSLADISKAKALLGYEAHYDVKAGLAEMIEWCLNYMELNATQS